MYGLIGLTLNFLFGSKPDIELDLLYKFVLLSVLVIASVMFFLALGAYSWKPKNLACLIFIFVTLVFFELRVSFSSSFRK